MTVGELKRFLEDYSDEIKIITRSSNFELRGSKVDARIMETRAIKKFDTFTDAFDHTHYDKEVYDNNDDNGETVIMIMG